MSSFDPKKKDSSSESAPLLQKQQPSRSPIPSLQPGVNYEAAGTSAPVAGMPPQQYGYPNNAMPGGSSYFIPPPGQYQIPVQQLQSNPMIVHSPNQPHPQMAGTGEGGMMPQPPFYYPFQPPEGGALPQYPYPVYPMQVQQQQQQQQQQPPRQQPRMGPSTPIVNTISHSPTASGSLPPLGDIFNAPRESQPSSGYGSMATSPKIYNAPINRLPPSGRTPQQQQQQIQPMRRTSSSNEFKQLQKGGSSSASKDHRRVHSDSPLRLNRLSRRANTDESPLSRGVGGHHRARTLSGGNPFAQRPRHRRGDSSSSYHSMGGGSYNAGSIADSSQVSMRSNIAKSSLFAGVDSEGRPLLYYPYEAIRLVMIPDHKNREKSGRGSRKGDYEYSDDDDDTAEEEDHLPLTIGHLYSDEPVNMDDYYEDYHRVSDDLEQGITPQWESLDTHPLRKNKNNTFTEEDKEALLPPTNYVVAVSDDIYKRMFSEVADAQTMPCGLYFCGHHEDVDYPSVWIPGTLVIILFSTLLYLSFLTEG